MKYLLVITIFNALFVVSQQEQEKDEVIKTHTKCPPMNVVYPCKCTRSFFEKMNNYRVTITCDGHFAYDLRQVFFHINHELPHQHYHELWIENTAIAAIEEDTLSGVTFDHIHLTDAVNVRKIHSNAFWPTSNRTKTLSIDGSLLNLENLHPPYDLFAMLNTFTSAEMIEFHPPKVTSIPEHAFRLPNLVSLSIGWSVAPMVIGEFAFEKLDRLEHLDLRLNKINYFFTNSLHFRNQSSKLLRINLDDNEISEVSIENPMTLTKFQRPVHLSLNNNLLAKLNVKIFKPFLDNNEQNTISGLNLNCEDCGNLWLVKSEGKYREQIINSICKPYNDPLFEHHWLSCK